jgi:nucleoside-diphosphate-sugar epimerase
MREVYVDGLKNVLAKIAPGTSRFLYISSTSVYGQKNGEWVDESSACQPTHPRGQICLEAEHLVRNCYAKYASVDANGASILRLAGIYGPGRLLRRVDALRSGAQLPGNPEAYLNLIHAQDAVQSICACEARGEPEESYLVCDNTPVKRRDYFESLAALVDAPAPTFARPGDSTPADERSDKRCSNRKLREELGVSLQFPSYECGLPAAVAPEPKA